MSTRVPALVAAVLSVAACDVVNPPVFPWCASESVALLALHHGDAGVVVDAGYSALHADAPTYHTDVAPIVAGRCARCHAGGGLAPFPLTTYDEVFAVRDAVKHAVVEREMPPWLPAKCCQHFANDTSLTDEQIAIVARWVDDGAPEGDPADALPPLPTVVGLPRVDRTMTMTTTYTPAPPEGLIDDTRCFLIEWPETTTKYVTGFEFHPGNAAVVHHALVLTLTPGQTRRYQRVDDASPGFGWSCPGGVVGDFVGYIGSYGPGWTGQETPEGLGHAVQPNTKLLLTIHYALPENGDAAGPDQSSFDVMLEDTVDGTLSAVAVYNAFWPYGAMPIEAGDADALFRAQYDPTTVYSAYTPLTIHSVNLHMHERGAKGIVGIRRQDGTDECLLQIDRYDSHWQENFVLAEPVVLEPGDHAFVECHFDNSEANQRVILGEREEVRDLNWGDGEEMCIGYLTVTSHVWGSRLTGD